MQTRPRPDMLGSAPKEYTSAACGSAPTVGRPVPWAPALVVFRSRRTHLVLLAAVLAAALTITNDARAAALPAKEWQRLPDAELRLLKQADKLRADRYWMEAPAKYDAFIAAFPESPAVPYALMQKAECLHLTGRLDAAITVYNDVLERFPHAVAFGAEALCHAGECHWEADRDEDAMVAWARAADDERYTAHALAPCIKWLADMLRKRNKMAEAVPYFEVAAVNARRGAKRASPLMIEAMNRAIVYHVRTKPDETALRAFYRKLQGFENQSVAVPADLTTDQVYWQRVWKTVREHARFTAREKDLEKACFAYWASVFGDKFPAWDDFRIQAAYFQYRADGDRDAWMQRLVEQFKRGRSPGDINQILKWLDACDVQDGPTAKVVFERLGLRDSLSDDQKVQLARRLREKSDGMVQEACGLLKDENRGKSEWLDYCHWRFDFHHGIPVATELTQVEAYAKEAQWKLAELLQYSTRYEEAIAAYGKCDRPPLDLWRSVDCLMALKNWKEALERLAAIEETYKSEGPAAALRIAQVHQAAGNKTDYIAALKRVLSQYGMTKESKTARAELDKLGANMGGDLQ